MVSRRFVLAAGAATAALALGAPTRAAEDPAAKRRIDLAGFQRTRIVRIARSACYARLGLRAEAQRAVMAADLDDFGRVLSGLRHGDPALGLVREDDGAVLEALRPVEALWLGYEARGREALGASEPETLAALVERERPMLEAMDAAVQVIARRYGAGDVALHLALAINLAGRQRTLVQVLAMEACLTRGIGADPEARRARLVETARLFEASLDALRHGMPMLGIRPPQTEALARQFDAVADRWERVAPRVTPMLAGEAADDATLLALLEAADALMEESDAAVKLYAHET
jgi:hypothetical protein